MLIQCFTADPDVSRTIYIRSANHRPESRGRTITRSRRKKRSRDSWRKTIGYKLLSPFNIINNTNKTTLINLITFLCNLHPSVYIFEFDSACYSLSFPKDFFPVKTALDMFFINFISTTVPVSAILLREGRQVFVRIFPIVISSNCLLRRKKMQLREGLKTHHPPYHHFCGNFTVF